MCPAPMNNIMSSYAYMYLSTLFFLARNMRHINCVSVLASKMYYGFEYLTNGA